MSTCQRLWNLSSNTHERDWVVSNNGALVSNFIIPVFKQVVCSTVVMSDNNLLMNNSFVSSLVCVFPAATTGKQTKFRLFVSETVTRLTLTLWRPFGAELP